jgi:hypothetical protein
VSHQASHFLRYLIIFYAVLVTLVLIGAVSVAAFRVGARARVWNDYLKPEEWNKLSYDPNLSESDAREIFDAIKELKVPLVNDNGDYRKTLLEKLDQLAHLKRQLAIYRGSEKRRSS